MSNAIEQGLWEAYVNRKEYLLFYESANTNPPIHQSTNQLIS
jgi:hypothetical protein